MKIKAKEIRKQNRARTQQAKDRKFTGENLRIRENDFGHTGKGYKRERIKFF